MHALKILIIDDEPEMRLGMSRILRSAGYAVLEAATGQEGLRLTQAYQPEILLLDVVLPDMDGVAVCRQIKADPTLRDTYVVLCSGIQKFVADRINGLEEGADDFISRPFVKREFLARINAIVRVKTAEQALKIERALLAQHIADRTAELSAVNAQLTQASHFKDDFLAMISHELRTPLHGILGTSEALQEGVYGPISDKQATAIDRITESGRHLLELITTMLDFSHFLAEKITLHIMPLAVEALCQASLQAIKPGADQKNLKVSLRVADNVLTMHADAFWLQQMLAHLLRNAVKFTPAGGTIGLGVTADAAQQIVYFSVWDTGIGIAQEDVKRLFQPFLQLDRGLTRKYEGTGLGLAFVERIVAMHGGRISVASPGGQGTRFTVALPWLEGTVPLSKAEQLSSLENPALPPDAATLAASMAALPPEELEFLRQLAKRGNAKKILEQLTQLETQDVRFLPVIAELRTFAQNFQVDAIVTLLTGLTPPPLVPP